MWLVALDRCRHHILFYARFSSHGVLARCRHGVLPIGVCLVCTYWRLSSIKLKVFGLYVKGHFASTAGCSILYICYGIVLLSDVGCYQGVMHLYCRKQQQHLEYAHDHDVLTQDVCSDIINGMISVHHMALHI